MWLKHHLFKQYSIKGNLDCFQFFFITEFCKRQTGDSLLLKEGEWEGDARGSGFGDICIRMADSLCYTAETNTPL